MTTNTSLSAPDNTCAESNKEAHAIFYRICLLHGEWCSKLICPASVESDAGHNSLVQCPASLGLTNGFFLEC